jgi:pilus assembly protein Flp/PilA
MSIQTINSFCQDEQGQDLVEYALVLGFMALACVAIITTAGTKVTALWTNINTALTNAAAAS